MGITTNLDTLEELFLKRDFCCSLSLTIFLSAQMVT